MTLTGGEMKIYLVVLMMISSLAISCKQKTNGSLVKTEAPYWSDSENRSVRDKASESQRFWPDSYIPRNATVTDGGRCTATYQPFHDQFNNSNSINCTPSEDLELTSCNAGYLPRVTVAEWNPQFTKFAEDVGFDCFCECIPIPTSSPSAPPDDGLPIP